MGVNDDGMLDDIDHSILRVLINNGRMPNSAVAQAANVPESTCYARVRAMIGSGVIKGFRTVVNMDALGQPIHAVALVKVRGGFRNKLLEEAQRLSQLEGVVSVLFLAGAHDLMVEFFVASSEKLRNFIAGELNVSDAIEGSETSVVMDALEGKYPLAKSANSRR